MKARIKKIMAAVLVMAMVVTMVPAMNTYAATKKTKSKVTYTLKKGTLTIKGKGAMPKKMTFVNNKKIKKIIIKKGVTSISNNAFYMCKNVKSVKIPTSVKSIGWNSFMRTGISEIKIPSSVKTIGQSALGSCKNLKNVVMPGDFKLKTKNGDDKSQNIMWNTNVDTIQFNTALKIKNVSYLLANNLVVSEADEAYKSINGVIYTKDGKGIVRVPSARKEIVIENGCTEFNLSAVTYAACDIDLDPIGGCEVLEKIVIPESVQSINNTKYLAASQRYLECKNIEIKTKKLDGNSIDLLLKSYWGDNVENMLGAVAKQIPEQVELKNNVYSTNDGVLLKYVGDDNTLKIEENIKVIGIGAFEYCNKLEKVELPDTVTVISPRAFYGCAKIKEIAISKNVRTVGERAFAGCDVLEEILLPDSVKVLGRAVFTSSGIKKAVLPNGITSIPESMFEGCEKLSDINMPETVTVIEKRAFAGCRALNIEGLINRRNIQEIQNWAFYETKWNNLFIPANIKKIEEGAFACEEDGTDRRVTIEGGTKQIDGDAFSPYGVRITFQRGIKSARASLYLYSAIRKKGVATLCINWSKIAGVSGYKVKVSTDSKFKKNTKSVYMSSKRVSAKVKMKTGSKTAYVKLIPYQKINGKKVYGKWSKTQWM